MRYLCFNGRMSSTGVAVGNMASGKKLVLSIVVDLISIILVLIPTIVFEFGHIEPYQRGFFCDDNTIKYPYKDNTIPSWLVFIVGVFVPVGVILLAEALHAYHDRRTLATFEIQNGYVVTPSCSIPVYVIAWYKLIGVFLFGLAVTQVITDICKYSIGRLRPHFLDVCKPNISVQSVCDNAAGLSIYVNNFTCTRPKDYTLDDSRLSFLSGHTSIMTYCSMFFVFYLQARFTWRGSKLLRHFMQAVAVYAALYVGLSRISDYKHHWSDVLAGAILGVIVAALTSLHVLQMFRRTNASTMNELADNNSAVMLANVGKRNVDTISTNIQQPDLENV